MKSGIFFERDGILNLTKVERGHQAVRAPEGDAVVTH